jgi:hypothetical protein
MTIKETWFYTWEDHRNALGYGIVVNKATGRIYGSITHDSNTDLRVKFAALLIFQAPFGLFRLTYRVLSLVAFDFAFAGYRNAKAEWLNERQQCQLAQQEDFLKSKTITQLPPNASTFYWKVSKNITCQLLLNVFKVATYPLAVIALEFAVLYGIFKPLDGRGLFAKIEEIAAKSDPYDIPFPLIANYCAPCMQPKDIWNRQNWHSWYEDYDADSYRSLLLRIRNITEKQDFFLDRENIKKTSYLPTLDLAYQKRNKAKTTQTIKRSFRKILKCLEEIPQKREKVVQVFEKNERIDRLLDILEKKKTKLTELFTGLSEELTKTS